MEEWLIAIQACIRNYRMKEQHFLMRMSMVGGQYGQGVNINMNNNNGNNNTDNNSNTTQTIQNDQDNNNNNHGISTNVE